MCLEIGRVDHYSAGHCPLGRKTFHHSGEHAHRALPFPPVIQCLVRPILSGRIPPAQPVVIDKYDAAQNPAVIDTRLAMAFGKYGARRAICSSVSQYRSCCISSQSLNHMLHIQSMGPEPRLAWQASQSFFRISGRNFAFAFGIT